MTFPLGSLRPAVADPTSSPRETKPAESAQPTDWQTQALLLLAGVAWLVALIALLSHHPADAAFSTSGAGEAVRNRAGVLGAWLSDLAFFVFGFSVWWAMAVGLHRWLRALAQLLRGANEAAPASIADARAVWPAWTVLVGLALLLASSAALEWTRLYRWESLLPGGHSGGVLGYLLGPASMDLLGFAGSGVLWIALLLAGVSLAFQFSWIHLADLIGERLDAWRDRRAERIEIAEDLRLGERALREREDLVEVENQLHEDHDPIVIETPLVNVPKSERVVKERQKPLFTELVDTKLPQVDLFLHDITYDRLLILDGHNYIKQLIFFIDTHIRLSRSRRTKFK
jgi:S-DNA-T family DNA segregation ATPase FtsK/SpoIIIE